MNNMEQKQSFTIDIKKKKKKRVPQVESEPLNFFFTFYLIPYKQIISTAMPLCFFLELNNIMVPYP